MRRLLLALVCIALLGCQPQSPTANEARIIAERVFSGSPYPEPIGPNVEWRVAVPYYNGDIWAGITEWPTAFNAVITIHPDYVRDDVIAHEGGHVVCWLRWRITSEACANQIMDEMT